MTGDIVADGIIFLVIFLALAIGGMFKAANSPLGMALLGMKK